VFHAVLHASDLEMMM